MGTGAPDAIVVTSTVWVSVTGPQGPNFLSIDGRIHARETL